ncbi:hypothetical protein AB0J38_14570 [Streptomyces sp. NPDC050095]|uniref:hypothetical protein n=1 Tax=unclassified Streptomyces TaxID=2593676 RepID=UPI003429E684
MNHIPTPERGDFITVTRDGRRETGIVLNGYTDPLTGDRTVIVRAHGATFEVAAAACTVVETA